MERIKKPSERVAAERCPYCHDLLEGAVEGFVTCDGCGTRHHGDCLAELGRCTVLGCERPLVPAARIAGAGLPETATRRLIRDRVRERVRGFVREHVRALPAPRLTKEWEEHYGEVRTRREGARLRDDRAAILDLTEELAALRRLKRRAEQGDDHPLDADEVGDDGSARPSGPDGLPRARRRRESGLDLQYERARTERARAERTLHVVTGAIAIIAVVFVALVLVLANWW